MTTWYLSFATEAAFLGACIVEADDAIGAVKRSHDLGANPGGEVLFFAWPDDMPIPDDMRNRLLNKREVVERLEGVRIGDATP